MDWDAYVHLAFDEIRIAGAQSPQISRRLVAALDDLLGIAPPERRPIVELQLELLRRAVSDGTQGNTSRTFALTPDSQGIGVAAGNSRRNPGNLPPDWLGDDADQSDRAVVAGSS